MRNMRPQHLIPSCLLIRRIIVLCVVAVLVTVGVAWAGKEAYRIVMSQDKQLCAHMLAIFNADMKKYRALEYEQHKEFIVWERVDTGEKLMNPYCGQTLKQAFDINNDGTDELVIRTRSCYQSQLTDSLYVFPLNSNAVELFKEQSPQVWDATIGRMNFQTYELKKMPGLKPGGLVPGIYTILTLEPFQFKGTFYVSMTDLSKHRIVIAKYLRGEELDDVCYFEEQFRR